MCVIGFNHCYAPDTLEAWLDGADAKHLKAAWNTVNPEWVNRKTIMMVSGDRAIDLLFRSEQSEKLIDLLANHPVGKTVLGLNSLKEWTNLALASKNVENLQAVFKYIGKVQWEEEEVVSGWLKCLTPPLNPILLDRILEEKWCLDVRIDNQDNTPLHRLVGFGEHEWVKKFVEAGANIDLKNKNHFSVRDIAMSGPDLNLMNILALAEKEHLNTTTSLQPQSTHSIRRL